MLSRLIVLFCIFVILMLDLSLSLHCIIETAAFQSRPYWRIDGDVGRMY